MLSSMNKAWLIAVLVVVAAFLVYAYTRTPHNIENVDTYTWRYEEVAASEFDAPQTRVFLDTSSGAHDLGVYTGSCADIPAENLLQGEITGVLCWWAGGGEELGVFKEGNSYFVRKGVQEESSAESEGFRGNFETLFIL